MQFSNIPLDIYTTICLSLDALDILAFGQTCSSMRAATQIRSVWIVALQDSSRKSQIFSGTFNVHHMDIDQLKVASTAPLRFLLKMKKGSRMVGTTRDVNQIMPQETYRIHASDLTGYVRPVPHRWFQRMSIVPGGRFLIAFCVNELVIYDLLACNPSQQHALPLRIPSNKNFPYITSPDPSGSGFRLLTYQNGEFFGQDKVTVFCIKHSENDQPPSVLGHSITGYEQASFGAGPFTMVGDLVIYSYIDLSLQETFISVWNCVENTVARWKIPSDFLNYQAVFTRDQYIFMVKETTASAWVMPTLDPRMEGKYAPMKDVPVALEIPLEWIYVIERGSCAKLSDWYNTFEAPSFFDLLCDEPFYHIFATYDLSLAEPNATSLPFTKSRFVRSVTIPRGQLDTINVAAYTLCHGRVVKPLMTSDGGQIFVITGIPTSGSNSLGGDQNVISQLVLPEGHPPDVWPQSLRADLGNFGVDAMSGRLAYLADGGKHIVVVNYLK